MTPDVNSRSSALALRAWPEGNAVFRALVLVCVGIPILRITSPNVARPFRVPMPWVIAPAGAIACLVVMAGLPRDTWLRLVVWRAASRPDQGSDAARLIGSARQLTATQGAQIGSQAVQLLGGHGFVKEFDNERWYRDLCGAGVLEGVLLV